ncbi:hypothetical protein [Bacillus sp. V3B]
MAEEQRIIILYAAKDSIHNHAQVVRKELLSQVHKKTRMISS